MVVRATGFALLASESVPEAQDLAVVAHAAALVYTAVINGVVAVPLILVIALIAGNRKIMGKYASGLLSKATVWVTFLAMGAAAVAMLLTLHL